MSTKERAETYPMSIKHFKAKGAVSFSTDETGRYVQFIYVNGNSPDILSIEELGLLEADIYIQKRLEESLD
jgi:hypothetical protein